MTCGQCKKAQATVHVTLRENGKYVEGHYCPPCAQKSGACDLNVTMSDIMAQTAPRPRRASHHQIRCQRCGISLADIKKKTRIGCSEDYKLFERDLVEFMDQYHGSSQHAGKVPGVDRRTRLEAELTRLQVELGKIVKQEKYEDAAKIRDRIRQIEADLEKNVGC